MYREGCAEERGERVAGSKRKRMGDIREGLGVSVYRMAGKVM